MILPNMFGRKFNYYTFMYDDKGVNCWADMLIPDRGNSSFTVVFFPQTGKWKQESYVLYLQC